ncbi:MAG: 6-phosphogluconolactonase [Proteobacteria bacterium]|nr:6-phosphogluconolactonase [Pseudomonadota bacterium]
MTQLSPRHFRSRAELDQALAARLDRALAAHGPSAIMLSGGSTPMPAYRAAAGRLRGHDDRLHVLFTDDRYVPPDSPESNSFQSRELLDALALPAESLLRIDTGLPLADAAADYQSRLSALLSSGVRIGLGLLGLGADGHTCSLFNSEQLAQARGRYAIAVQRPDGLSAVSVTPELIATVAEPVFVVAGPDKAPALARLQARDETLVAWRAVQGCSNVELWVAP